MPRPKSIVPKLTRHKARGLGVVRLNGHDHYLSHWPADSEQPPPDVIKAYDRLIAEWLACNQELVGTGHGPYLPAGATAGLTVNKVLLKFWRHAEVHYQHPRRACSLCRSCGSGYAHTLSRLHPAPRNHDSWYRGTSNMLPGGVVDHETG
jgi:hypothetical protein